MRHQKKRALFTQKICRFCSDKIQHIDFFETKLLKPLISERGKIVPSRISGNCARHQRQMTEAIKRARSIALLPFSVEH